MGLKIFGDDEKIQAEVDRLGKEIESLGHDVLAETETKYSRLDERINSLLMDLQNTNSELTKQAGELKTLSSKMEKNSSLLEQQVEVSIPNDIAVLSQEIDTMKKKTETTALIIEKLMQMVKQITSPDNLIHKKIADLEDKVSMMGKIDIVHLVDKLDLVREQIEKAKSGMMPEDFRNHIEKIDFKLQKMEKRLDGLEDQTIRPLEEVEYQR